MAHLLFRIFAVAQVPGVGWGLHQTGREFFGQVLKYLQYKTSWTTVFFIGSPRQCLWISSRPYFLPLEVLILSRGMVEATCSFGWRGQKWPHASLWLHLDFAMAEWKRIGKIRSYTFAWKYCSWNQMCNSSPTFTEMSTSGQITIPCRWHFRLSFWWEEISAPNSMRWVSTGVIDGFSCNCVEETEKEESSFLGHVA